MSGDVMASFCFVHGFGDREHRFADLVVELRARGNFALTIGLPDYHSHSPSLDLHNQLVDEIRRSFALAPSGTTRIIVAHSLGGLLSVAHEKSSMLADRFLLIEPSIRDADLAFFGMLQSLPRGRRVHGFSAALSANPTDIPNDYLTNLHGWSEEAFEAYCQLAIQLIPSASAALGAVARKAMLVYGKNSWGDDGPQQKDTAGFAISHEYERSGHWPFISEAERFVSLVTGLGREE